MPPAELTDRQLRASVYKVVRAYLEVERGLRAYEQFERFVTAAEYRRHRNRPCDPRLRTGRAVLPTDVGPIHLDRHLRGQITATVTTRETDQRWGALVLHFVRQPDGCWRIDQLERLSRSSVARQPTPGARVDLDQRIEHVAEERRLANAAQRATTTRLTEARNTTGRRAAPDVEMLEAQQRAWERRRAELDDELKSLWDRRDLQQRFPEAGAHPIAPATPTEPSTKQELGQQPPERNAHPTTPAQSTDVSHRQLTAALGPTPHDVWRRRLWQGLADEIHTYRRRWDIADSRTLLGPEPDDPDHQRERQELADLLRASARELSSEPHSQDLPTGADIARSAARQYGRSIVTER